jgi:hypothetical protein
MRRSPVLFVVGVVLSLAVATPAYATYSVRIEGATVPHGESDVLQVDVSFACDADSDPVVEITAVDQDTPAHGYSRPQWRDQELCDGQTHPGIAEVKDDSGAKFRTGDRIRVTVSLTGNQHQSARDDKEVTAA